LFCRARLTISIQSAWDTQCKHVYKILASSSKLVYQVAHDDLRWKRTRKRENSMTGFRLHLFFIGYAVLRKIHVVNA